MSSKQQEPKKPFKSWFDFDNHIRPEHLRGKTASLQISRITVEEYFVRQKNRVVATPTLWFHGTTKNPPVNTTNRRALTKFFGDDPMACLGRCVILKSQKVPGKEEESVTVVGIDEQLEKSIATRAQKMSERLDGKPAESAPSNEGAKALSKVEQLQALRARAQEMGAVIGVLDLTTLTDEQLDSELVRMATWVQDIENFQMPEDV